ncbi:hypothetical protein ACFQOZ_03085 [Comamonas endophytica]|uniref:hypothetical protein n=1 Tax=Comamonas endophytica TaxID=2949090 RepID=UPI0036151EDD
MQIEFVENETWKLVWTAAAVVLLAITLSLVVPIWQTHRKRVALDQELASFQALQLQELAERKKTANPLGHVRAASEAAAVRLLQRDWNQLYDTIEAPALADARLLQLSFDSATGDATLEYELDKLEQAAHVSNALDAASRQIGLWRLERFERAEQTRSMSGAATVKGYWRSRVDQTAW